MMDTKPMILIIDDDPNYSAMLAERFEHDGLQAVTALFAEEGYQKAVEQQPDLIVLDVNLQQEGEGFELLTRLQEVTTTPIIVLTGRTSRQEDLEAAGEGGATHYFNKLEALPLSLSAFVRRQLTAMGRLDHAPRRLGYVVLDPGASKLFVRGVPVPLTELQLAVMEALLAPPAGEWKELSRIARRIYGDADEDEELNVRSHVKRIRSRLKKLNLGVWIESEYYSGYRLVAKGVNDAPEQGE